MREERGQLSGDVVVYEEFTLWGTVGGDVKVIEGGKFYMRGTIYGNLLVESGGRVHLFGNLKGNLTLMEGTKVILSGMVGRDAVNQGGRLYIDANASVMGKLKTYGGKTQLDHHAKVSSVWTAPEAELVR